MDGCGQLLNSFPTLRLKQEPSLASSKKILPVFWPGCFLIRDGSLSEPHTAQAIPYPAYSLQETNMRFCPRSIAIALSFVTASFCQAQGGPYIVDYLFPQAWPNPVSTVEQSWLDPDVSSSVLSGQTLYVNNTTILAQKQKDYYWFQDKDKQSGVVHQFQVDHDSCRVWLEWQGMFYPSNGGYDCQYDAVPFWQLDQKCFASLSGPYCDLPIGVTFVGQLNGYPMIAATGLFRKMGGAFTAAQVQKVLDRNSVRNTGVLRSDLRQELVNEFLAQYPEIDPADIPVDYHGDELTTETGKYNTAVVSHIIPAIAPEGNGAGRNAYSNAMVISRNLKLMLTDPFNETGDMPSDAMLLYFEFLAAKYGAKSPSLPEARFSVNYIRDLRGLESSEVEVLSQEETRTVMEYAGLIRPSRPKQESK
jgi:hypothetical protein